ncbi:hypothetical protein VCR12J2_680113 [Vibrio coralliirubri]|nr:hypothetical protein VCR12J2_680113 [Vibrio coralliirubri]
MIWIGVRNTKRFKELIALVGQSKLKQNKFNQYRFNDCGLSKQQKFLNSVSLEESASGSIRRSWSVQRESNPHHQLGRLR